MATPKTEVSRGGLATPEPWDLVASAYAGERLLRAAGFGDVGIHRRSHTLTARSAQDFWESVGVK